MNWDMVISETEIWDPIFDFISSSKLPDWDKENVAVAVAKATETWGEADSQYEVVGTEIRGEEPFPYVIDLLLRAKDGTYLGVDWKTKKSGKLDERFVMREERSPQMRLYGKAISGLYETGERRVFPLRYEVRGITLEEKPKTLTIPLVITGLDAWQAWTYIEQVSRMRVGLIECGQIPWTRDSSGCRAFGPLYACEYEPICWNGAPMPEGDMERAGKRFSHSSAQEFLRCPERYRLGRIINKPDDDDDIGAAGRVFHGAMEMIYKGMKGEGNERTD